MPHFIIDYSSDVLTQKSPYEIMDAVYHPAQRTLLITENDIKVRIRPFEYYKLGANKKDFIHVSGNIMEGCSTEQ